jgi:transcriptional regulator with XRE-family HTH domain
MYGERIRELRKERGWTMKQLGQRLDVAESTVSGYENEIRRPDLDILLRLSELFNVSVDYLIGRVTETRETPAAYNVAIWNGNVESLTEEEAHHLKNTLEMYRLWKASRPPGASDR